MSDDNMEVLKNSDTKIKREDLGDLRQAQEGRGCSQSDVGDRNTMIEVMW
jgi:hypothetical protein